MAPTDSSGESGRGIDHVAIVVRDLDAAEARFRALGFTVTPRAYHPWGTANHLVQCQRSFIEIVGIADASQLIAHTETAFSFSAHARDYLQEREGMAMIVFSSADADADTARWRASGLPTYEPVYFERTATLPDGAQVKVAFTVSFVTHPELPACAFFVCQQFFPEHFWKRDYQRHANGATNLGTATLQVAGDPARFTGFVEKLTGRPAQPMGGGIGVALACGRLDLVTPAACHAGFPLLHGAAAAPAGHFANLGIEVASLDTVAELLTAAAIPFSSGPAGIDVSPEQVFGVGLRFGAT